MGILKDLTTGRSIYLKPTHILGRDPNIVDTPLTNPMCSRLQCVLHYQNGSWFINDKSKNGTFLNGKRLSQKTIQFVWVTQLDSRTIKICCGN